MATPNKYILVVDDEPLLRTRLKETLLGIFPSAQVIEAKDGADALGKIGNQRFDLVITDLMMPKMDGKTLVQSIKLVPKQLKPAAIIVLTSEHSNEGSKSEMGAVTFISKVAEPAEFRVVVSRALGLEPATRPETTKVDVAFINPFIEGVLNVLSTTANVHAEKDKVFIRDQAQISGDISAIIAMNSQSFMGSMAISFEKRCFLFVLSGMLGEEFAEITPENQDAAGEICNQVFGYAKNVLNQSGHTLQGAIPSLIVGDRHTIKHMINGVCLAVRFVTAKGAFTIEAIVQPATAKA